MAAYYNDNDPKICAWLRELVKEELIADGEVDERSILDIRPSDLAGFTQCHLFAGIGGWSYALRLAGWPDDRPVWTGSVPCQPFSVAGKGLGEQDERHLWPEFRRLIAECHPPVVFGEQVESTDGRLWLDGVQTDLEACGYAVGTAALPAAAVGAPQPRLRLFWVGNSAGNDEWRYPVSRTHREGESSRGPSGYGPCGMVYPDGIRSPEGNGVVPSAGHGNPASSAGGKHSPWSEYRVVLCREPRTGEIVARRIEPSIFSLAYGVPGRVGLLRGAGNAIVPQVAAEFVMAHMEVV